jgi:hypothetical protein
LFLFSFLYWRMGFEVLVLRLMQADCFASLHGNTSMSWWVGMYWVFFFNVLVVGLEGNQSIGLCLNGCWVLWNVSWRWVIWQYRSSWAIV